MNSEIRANILELVATINWDGAQEVRPTTDMPSVACQCTRAEGPVIRGEVGR